MGKIATISERLQQGMQERGLNQTDLAEASGLHKSSIHGYLSGRAEPKQGAIAAIALALNCDEAWLLGYDVPMTRVPDELRYIRNSDLSPVKEKVMIQALHSPDELLVSVDRYMNASDIQRKAIDLLLKSDDANLVRLLIALHEVQQ